MNIAIVREREEKGLHEVPASIKALIIHLTEENNGLRVYDKKTVRHPETGEEVYVMSNGLSYSRDFGGKWYVIR